MNPDRTETRSRQAWLRLLPTLAIAASCASVRSVSLPSSLPGPAAIDTLQLRVHTRVLAHDSMAGRGTGTPGNRQAASYLASQLRAIGLRPVRGDPQDLQAYVHPVPLLRARVGDAELTIDDGPPLRHGNGFIVGRVGRAGLRAATGPVARLGSDSTAVTAGAWLLLDGALGEAAARWLPVWRAAGVIGLLVRLPQEGAVAAYQAQLGDVRWHLRDGPPDPIWQPDLPVLMMAPSLAAAITTHSRVTFEPHARIEPIMEANVVGVLPAQTGDMAGFVVLSAHYDHLGVAPGMSGADSIFNGFSDNAAGVSMLLAIASASSAAPPPRPLLFLFTTAEEVGLLGSIHFVRQEDSLVARTHAVLNLDAGAPPAAPTRWRIAAGTRSWAGAVAARVVESHGWAYREDPGSPNSDHWPFVARGIPAVFLIPDGGYENTTPEQEQQLRSRWDRYHHVDDEWSEDFPFIGLERYATLARDIAYALAHAPASQP